MAEKAVIYARVSSKEQDETGYSLPAQEKLLKEYAERKGFTISKVFSVAESASGSKQRIVFAEMIEYLEKNSIENLLCEKVDRLTRNMREAVVANDWVECNESRKIHFVKQNLIISKSARSDEKFRWDIEIVLSKKYISNLSEEVKKGQKEKIAQGWLPTKPPLGYVTIGDKGHKIHVIDPSVGPVIKKAFEIYATGNYSLMALRDQLYDDGLRTRSGSRLAKGRLHEILSDPFYYGAMRWNGETYEAKHEPLVSKGIFDRVQEIMHGKTTPHYKRHIFKFTKMMKCGECGYTISGEIHKGHIYYTCKHSKECSQRATTREEKIEKSLMGVFNFFEAITPSEAEELRQSLLADHQVEATYKQESIERLTARYKALQRQLDVLYEDRRITMEKWQEKQATINEEQKILNEQLARLKSEESKYFQIYSNILELALRAREIYKNRSPEQRRQLLGYLFSNLTLKDQKVAHIYTQPVIALSKRVQEKIDTQNKFELLQTPRPKPFDGLVIPPISSLLAWQSAFRTYDWAKALGDPDVAVRHISQLMSLI